VNKNTGRDKRLYPRVEHNLPVKLAVNGYKFETSTQNISCIGAYCRINKYMPPFTKIMVNLALPISGKKCNVECKGVIVRSDDDSSGGFNIAIFFNNIAEASRKKIERYVKALLPKELTAAK